MPEVTPHPPSHPRYRERLRVPASWWVVGTLLVSSLWVALIVAVPGWLAWTVSGAALALLARGLTSYAAEIVVTSTDLRAGRAHIATAYLGAVVALNREQTRQLAGVDADARAYLLMRPYLSGSVRVEISDPRDPTPYWLLGTRRPNELAQALDSRRDRTPLR
ncbi:MAG: DUF3093 domain-containing protein [Nocardioides sp.]